jgi:hypothetical protein
LSLVACSDKGEDGDGGGSVGSIDTGSEGGDDVDGDGFAAEVDCDDSNPAINPAAAEVCDGTDNNCDGLIDDADPAVELSTGSAWLLDGDGDGFGDDASTVEACEAPVDHVTDGGDCDDGDSAVNPDATEVCDDMDVDEDCSGAADNDDAGVDPATTQTYFPDNDGDGFGDAAFAGLALCEDPSTTEDPWFTDNSDCDDGDAAVNPDAVEVCDELDVDEDCSGTADNEDSDVDSATQSVFYADGDGDGFGNELDPGTLYCDAFSGVVVDKTDCDDVDGTINPAASEVCDEFDVDEDCSGAADDADEGVDTVTQTLFYADSDSDGFGNDADTGTLYCDAPSGMVADSSDCNDGDGDVNPAATERCDGIDNDCDSATAEAGTATFEDTAGTVTDYTTTLTGSSGAPAVVSLATAGELAVCEGTWYVNLDVTADVDIVNPSGAPSDVVLDGAATATVISVATDGISVHLEGLSIQNGAGSGDSRYDTLGVSGGGIDCTADGASISAMSVDIQSNSASAAGEGVGGGIGALGCDLTLEDMVIADNIAGYGGGIYVDSGSLSLVDSVVSDNIVDQYGGGLMAYDSEAAASVELIDVDMRDNTAAVLGGGAFASADGDGDGVSVRCIGSSGSTAGFRSNAVTSGAATYGGGLFLVEDVSFEADNCDFGTSAGGDDNSPEDISVNFSRTYDFDDDESFICTGGYCGTDTTFTLGLDSYGYTDVVFLAGNIILADSDAVIRSFGMNLVTSSSSCSADFYVLSNTSASTSGWTVEYANTGVSVSSTADYVDSGTVNVVSSSGTYYVLLSGTTCTSTGLDFSYGFTASSATDAGFGTVLGYAYDNDYTSAYTDGDSVAVDSFNSGFALDTEVTVLVEP